jgi:hypothetical protein
MIGLAPLPNVFAPTGVARKPWQNRNAQIMPKIQMPSPQDPGPFLTHAFAVQAGRVIGSEAISDI